MNQQQTNERSNEHLQNEHNLFFLWLYGVVLCCVWLCWFGLGCVFALFVIGALAALHKYSEK